MLLSGVIFDMDGVLCDSEMLIRDAAREMFREDFGVEVASADFEPFVGAGEDRYLGGVAEKHGLVIDVAVAKSRTYDLYNVIIKGRLGPVEGALEFVTDCVQAGLRVAVATGADLARARSTLAELGLSVGDFSSIVTASDGYPRKPAPDLFRAAATGMGLAADCCLVVEDALLGIEAGKAAGSACLGLTTTFGAADLLAAGADWVARSFVDLPEDLLAACRLKATRGAE